MFKFVLLSLAFFAVVFADDAPFPVLTYKTGTAGADLGVWMTNNKGKFAAFGVVKTAGDAFPEFVVVCAIPVVANCAAFKCEAADKCAAETTIAVTVEESVAKFVFAGQGATTKALALEGDSPAGFKIEAAVVAKQTWKAVDIALAAHAPVKPDFAKFTVSLVGSTDASVVMEFGADKYGLFGIRKPADEAPGVVIGCAAGVAACKEFKCDKGTNCAEVTDKGIILSSKVSADGKSTVMFTKGTLLQEKAFNAVATFQGDFKKDDKFEKDKVEGKQWKPTYVMPTNNVYAATPILLGLLSLLIVSL